MTEVIGEFRTQVFESELAASLGELLEILKEVASGNFDRRVDVKYPESHPVGALAQSINEMASSLQEARRQSAEYSQQLAEQIATIERQQAAIRDLSMPIIEVWPGVLCVPVMGVLDSYRATEITGALLNAIVDKRAPFAIIDVTGIEVMDTSTADHFIRMARSVRLLGARCVLSGVRPNIARTIVEMGVDLQGIDNFRTMREALRSYVHPTAVTGVARQPKEREPMRESSKWEPLPLRAQKREAESK